MARTPLPLAAMRLAVMRVAAAALGLVVVPAPVVLVVMGEKGWHLAAMRPVEMGVAAAALRFVLPAALAVLGVMGAMPKALEERWRCEELEESEVECRTVVLAALQVQMD